MQLEKLDLDPSNALRLALEFHNNDRNVQLHLPINFTLTWSSGMQTQLTIGRRVLAHEYPEAAQTMPFDSVEDAAAHPVGFDVYI